MTRLKLSLLGAALAALALPWSAQAALSSHRHSVNAAQAALPSHRHAVNAAQGTSGRIAFTRNNNVYLMNADGSGQRALTTDGTGDYKGVNYPWYSWSPDGKYLLVLRSRGGTTDLLLLNQDGVPLRRLATGVAIDYFFPTWAMDSDQVAYVASTRSVALKSGPGVHYTVKSVDVQGTTASLWSYDKPVESGCGGGHIPSPSGDLYGYEKWWSATSPMAPTFQWSIGQHLAVYSEGGCGVLASIDLTAIRTGRTQTLRNGLWGEAALDPAAPLLAVVFYGGAGQLLVDDLRRGAWMWHVNSAELPVWSRDGRVLYFEERKAGEVLHLQDSLGNTVDGATFRSAIFAAPADGSRLTQLTSWQDAYGFGPLQVAPDGNSLVFSRVDNIWNLWRHRQPGNVVTDALVKQYGPHVSIQRLVNGKLVTIARDASRPAL